MLGTQVQFSLSRSCCATLGKSLRSQLRDNIPLCSHFPIVTWRQPKHIIYWALGAQILFLAIFAEAKKLSKIAAYNADSTTKNKDIKKWVSWHHDWNKQPLFILTASPPCRKLLHNGSKVDSEEAAMELSYKLKRCAHNSTVCTLFCVLVLDSVQQTPGSPHWESYQRARGGEKKENKGNKEKAINSVKRNCLYLFWWLDFFVSLYMVCSKYKALAFPFV